MKYILAQDKSKYSSWQLETALRSLHDLNVNHRDIYVLLGSYGYSKHFKTLFRTYRKVNFIEYRNLSDLNYKPSVKPYLLWKFFEQYSHLVNEQWFLMDCDVVLTKLPSKFSDKYIHVSDCSSYMNIEYLNRCGYEFNEISDALNIDSKVIKSVDRNIGGAQYVFKGVKADVWKWAYDNIETLRKFIRSNPRSNGENNPFQLWCSEMFLVAYSMKLHGYNLKHSKKLDFCWSTDLIENIKPIIHNAGVTGRESQVLFNKGHFVRKLPSDDLNIDDRYVSYIYYKHVNNRNLW